MKQSIIIENIQRKLGIPALNEMQQQVAKVNGNELIIISPTGSGKTVAFSIPLLRNLIEPMGKPQGIIIAPSRELVSQIAEVIRPIAIGYKTVAFYGGHSMTDETNSLLSPPDIIVATPGRLLDHINRGNLDLSGVRTLIFDEYDKALDLGFHDEMRRIVRDIKRYSLTILTSATTLSELPDFLKLKKPITLNFSTKSDAPRKRTRIARVTSPEKDKLDTLHKLLQSLSNGKHIIFVNHRESAERVYNHLRKLKYPVGLYHGGLDQIDREKAIDLLNNGTTPLLVSTDLASRGLDIEMVQSVIHYHLPPTAESWTHRNGRTARIDATGEVYTIIAEGEYVANYINWDFDYTPSEKNDNPIKSETATIHFNAGKKEKISRGDIVGFLVNKGGLESQKIGKIVVKDHCALVAIPAQSLNEVLNRITTEKIKNKRVRITAIK